MTHSKQKKHSKKTPKKKGIKKSRRRIDRAYHPRNMREGSHHPHLGFRFSRKKGVKVSCVLEQGKSLENIQAEVEKSLKQKFTELSPYRPARKIKFSKQGSPISIETPGKTVLQRSLSIGVMHFFSNDKEEHTNPKQSVEALAVDSAFYDSDAYKHLKEIHDTYKFQQVTVNKALLAATEKEAIKNQRRRVKSQAQVLAVDNKKQSLKAASANYYANAMQVFSQNIKWEWLHMIAHMILGQASQQPNNLVGGTFGANTAMHIVEANLSKLSKAYPQGFNLAVHVALIPNTHFATKITYTISTDDFTLPFVFDAQNVNTPHVTYKLLFDKFIDTLLETIATHKDSTVSKKLFTEEKKSSSLFFNRKKEADKEQELSQPIEENKHKV